MSFTTTTIPFEPCPCWAGLPCTTHPTPAYTSHGVTFSNWPGRFSDEDVARIATKVADVLWARLSSTGNVTWAWLKDKLK